MTELLVLNDGKQEMQAVSLDGTRVRTLITGIDERADGIVVDQLRGHVYWTNMGAPDPGSGPRSEEAYARNGSLERADLDGSNRVTIVPRGAFTTGKQLAADFEAGVLYWCDREGMQVLSCNLDGSELRPLVVPAVGDVAAQTIANHSDQLSSLISGTQQVADTLASRQGPLVTLLGNAETVQKLKDGVPAAEIVASWQPALTQYDQLRRKYFLYK